MGIFPYHTPVEHNRMDRAIKHYDAFVKLRGYEVLFDRGCGPHPWQGTDGVTRTDSSRPWKGKNGKEYMDREEFRKDNGWYPYLIRDGICYGWYEPQYNDGYKDPWDEEVKFLTELGYKHLGDIFSDDYMKNINLSSAFYNTHGWLPRWEKDGQRFGHPELLLKLGYEYTGIPAYPVIQMSDFETFKGWC